MSAVIAGKSLATHIGLSARASLTLFTGHFDLTIGAERANLALAGGFSTLSGEVGASRALTVALEGTRVGVGRQRHDRWVADSA